MLNYLSNYIHFDSELLVGDFIQYKDIIKCNVCFNIPYNPECCAQCENLFCSNCISSWTRANNTCPTCRYDYERKDLSRLTKELISKVTLYCPFKSQGCAEQIAYPQFHSHLENCKYTVYICEECNVQGNIDFMKAHKCDYQCDMCLCSIPNSKKSDHLLRCISNNKCKYCGFFVHFNEMKNHVFNECSEVRSKCTKCGIEDKREYLMSSHGMSECVDIIYRAHYSSMRAKLLKMQDTFQAYSEEEGSEIPKYFKCVKRIRKQFY